MRVVTAWLWADRSVGARMARLALLPPALVLRGVAALRSAAYGAGLGRVTWPEVPVVAIGNLTVGGSGKTPIAAWIAARYARQGHTPGILLRGYGGDEGAVHRRLTPGAVVVERADRVAGARDAVARGAQVLVLDDAFQRLDIGRDLNIAVVSAESGRAAPWTVPAGPWREAWRALGRADLVIVTRKRADKESAAAMAARVRRTVAGPVALTRLGIAGFSRLCSGRAVGRETLRGARVLLAAGVADPASVAQQCRQLGARVEELHWRDHQPVEDAQLARLLQEGATADYVVVTEKDAVKLRARWPAGHAEPLVASLAVEWEAGLDEVEAALDAAVASARLPKVLVHPVVGDGSSRSTR